MIQLRFRKNLSRFVMVKIFLALLFGSVTTIYFHANLVSNKSEIISQALTEVVSDGIAPGMIAAIIYN